MTPHLIKNLSTNPLRELEVRHETADPQIFCGRFQLSHHRVAWHNTLGYAHYVMNVLVPKGNGCRRFERCQSPHSVFATTCVFPF